MRGVRGLASHLSRRVMIRIQPGLTLNLEGNEHVVVSVTGEYVITRHNDGERVWNRNHIEARVGNVPLVPEGGVRLCETWYTNGKLELHVEGSSKGLMEWLHYRTGRSLTIHADGTWTEDP
jgi:hypothetical protein